MLTTSPLFSCGCDFTAVVFLFKNFPASSESKRPEPAVSLSALTCLFTDLPILEMSTSSGCFFCPNIWCFSSFLLAKSVLFDPTVTSLGTLKLVL